MLSLLFPQCLITVLHWYVLAGASREYDTTPALHVLVPIPSILQVQQRAAGGATEQQQQQQQQQQQTMSQASKAMTMNPTFQMMRQKQSGAGLKA
jgi:hypothetical protein